MRVLVVESNHDAGLSLKKHLSRSCAVDWTQCGEKGFWLARINAYDIIVLGKIETGKSFRDICRELRGLGKTVPIIVLIPDDHPDARVDALSCGADDCLAMPVHFEELTLRIQVILRRPHSLMPRVLELEDLELNIEKQEVCRKGRPIYLTRKEFQLLEYLLRNSNKVISRGEILDHVWESESDPFSNTIETHIFNLRKKIDHGHRRKLITTVPGRGYKLGAIGAAFIAAASLLWLWSSYLPDAGPALDSIS